MAKTSGQSLRADAIAGMTGAAVVLPQAVAFASIAGLPPEYGLYTAMITPAVAAIFGSSIYMVSGPTTAISAVVFSALVGKLEPGSPEFVQAAIVLALMVGLIQVAFSLARFGRLAGFVSHSVMVGFTAAAALLIFVSQMGPALGLPPSKGGGILGRLEDLVANVSSFDVGAVIVAGVTFATVVGFRVFLPKWPGFLIGIVVGALFAQVIGGLADNLTYIGAIPAAFPAFLLPGIDLENVPEMVESAFAIALIGLLEAIAIGRSIAQRTRTEFSANREVLGQGLSNVAGGFFQCYPGSGSFTRSGVNLESGAMSPFSAVFAALFLAAMVAVLRPFIQFVPIAAIAGLILYVAYKLLDFKEIGHLIATSRVETGIAAVTFAVGLVANLEFAIYVGTIVSLSIFLGKSASPDLAVGAPDPASVPRKLRNAEIFDLPECPSIVIVRLDGPLFFGSVDALNRQLRDLRTERPEQVSMILIMHGVGDVDLAGVDMLVLEADRRRSAGGDLFVVAHYPPLAKRLTRLGLMDLLGEDRIFDNKGAAISAAVETVALDACAVCEKRVFIECAGRPDRSSERAAAGSAENASSKTEREGRT